MSAALTLPPEIERAADEVGYWDDLGDASDVLRVAGEMIERAADQLQEVQQWLGDRGLSVGEIVDMQVQLAERNKGFETPEARDYARTLIFAGLSPEKVGYILGVDPADVARYTERYLPRAGEIMELHRGGLTPVQIGRHLDLPRTTVQTVLKRAGVTPNRQRRFVTAEQRQQVSKLMSEGASRQEIAEATGLDLTQVDNTRRSLRKQVA